MPSPARRRRRRRRQAVSWSHQVYPISSNCLYRSLVWPSPADTSNRKLLADIDGLVGTCFRNCPIHNKASVVPIRPRPTAPNLVPLSKRESRQKFAVHTVCQLYPNASLHFQGTLSPPFIHKVSPRCLESGDKLERTGCMYAVHHPQRAAKQLDIHDDNTVKSVPASLDQLIDLFVLGAMYSPSCPLPGPAYPPATKSGGPRLPASVSGDLCEPTMPCGLHDLMMDFQVFDHGPFVCLCMVQNTWDGR